MIRNGRGMLRMLDFFNAEVYGGGFGELLRVEMVVELRARYESRVRSLDTAM